MKGIFTTIAFAISIHCYSQNSYSLKQKDSLYNKIILGTWTIDNTLFTYLKNGTYTARLAKRKTGSGSWHIRNGIFVIKPAPFGIEREYKIISLSSKFFKYQLSNKSIDASIYVERKIVTK
jgi:hypothetical protein